MSSGRENLAGNVAGRPRMPSFISGKTQIERLFTEPARIHKQKACAATYTAAAPRPCTPIGYRRGIPAASQAARVRSSHSEHCTSPMWALPSSSIHTRDCPMPPPIVRGNAPASSILWKGRLPPGRHSRLWSAGCRGRPGPPGSPLRRPQTHIPEPDSKTGCRR